MIVMEAENVRIKNRVKELEAARAARPKTITILGIGVGVGVVSVGIVWYLTAK